MGIKIGLKFCSLMLTLAICSQIMGQERIKPAKTYLEGDVMTAPLYGIKMKIPPNWTGYLPQDIELFTLRCDTAKDVSVIMYPQKSTLNEIRAGWANGKELDNGILIKAEENITLNDSLTYAKMTISNDKSVNGYGLVACGSFDVCYTLILSTQAKNRDKYIDALPGLAKNFTFYDPAIGDRYEWFDWNKELEGKYLVSFKSITGATKQNHLWLCKDGTFTAKLKRKGLYKGDVGQYKGNQKGTYSIEGAGKTATLTLNFNKLESVEISMEVREREEIYVNGNRFFVSENQKCK